MQYRAGLKEQGVTGMRDAVVLELSFRDGTVTSTKDGLQGWFRAPYDPSITGFTANLSDLAKFDALFPGHALTNARELTKAPKKQTNNMKCDKLVLYRFHSDYQSYGEEPNLLSPYKKSHSHCVTGGSRG